MELKTNLLNPKNFNRSLSELQEYLLLCIFVSSKTAKFATQKVNELMHLLNWPEFPLDILKTKNQEEIESLLKKIKSGQYKRISNCLYQLSKSDLDLNHCSAQDLESIPGIGMKTSRFFIVYSRDVKDYCILDTHILKWLREQGYNAPKATPSGNKYKLLEYSFSQECKKRNLTPQELDLEIWKSRQKSWIV
jgi:thermostable 8-oxoguanine DNA glycosylase